MDDLRARLRASLELARARVQASRDQAIRSIRFTRAILGASRTLMIGVGLTDNSKHKVLYLPFQAYWVLWWFLFLVGAILPTYPAEPFLVFPSILALAVVWLFGMGQFAHAWLGEDLRAMRITPAVWQVFLAEFQKVGIELPPELLTPESAQEATKQLEFSLPGLVRQSVVDFSSLAAIQALLAGVVAVVGLLVGQTLADMHLWRGWSPVSVLYAAALPTGLSLVGYGLLPFIVARLMAALRLQSEIAASQASIPVVVDIDAQATSPAAIPVRGRRRARKDVGSTVQPKVRQRAGAHDNIESVAAPAGRPASPPVD